MMLRRRDERRELVAAEREEHAARRLTDRSHRLARIDHFGPAIARNGHPGRPPQRHERHADLTRGGDGVCRHAAGVRMRRIDQSIDALAAPDDRRVPRHRQNRRRGPGQVAMRASGAAGERKRDVEVAALGQRPARTRASVVPPRIRTRFMSLSNAVLCAIGPDTAASPRWLSIVGIGEDGVEGLSPPRAGSLARRKSCSAAGAIWALRRR